MGVQAADRFLIDHQAAIAGAANGVRKFTQQDLARGDILFDDGQVGFGAWFLAAHRVRFLGVALFRRRGSLPGWRGGNDRSESQYRRIGAWVAVRPGRANLTIAL
jgi:hypothetical protein